MTSEANLLCAKAYEEIGMLITSPSIAAGSFQRAYTLAFAFIPQADWAEWDRLSTLFQPAWESLLHARTLLDGIAARVRSLTAMGRLDRAIEAQPRFATACVLLLGLYKGIALRAKELARKSKAAESKPAVETEHDVTAEPAE